ncbi:MAG TPA: succinylglutamate desuccinylase/aspartoacylase family protein [Flavobacteriaceae bacterium]|nr:succinylglutamate desuccinylase/aspartoacylase family protein [Flavobacteriaceae bacterium]
MERIIGKYQGYKKENFLLVTAGIHGNEPSGVLALQRVFSQLEKYQPEISGTILGLAGNTAALDKKLRFIDEDLNRTWTEKNISNSTNPSREISEMKQLISLIENEENKGFSNYYFLDCHSTSSDSVPYISVEDVGKNDSWAHRFPVYIVRGFSSLVNGSIDKYLSKKGMTGFAFEGGQHIAESTTKNHEALIWLAIQECFGLDLKHLGGIRERINILDEYPPQKTFDIIYRHGLENIDEFQMKKGFKNFQKISEGEVLAVQNGEELISKWNARIFMPLYQKQGKDGFFIIKEMDL